MYIRDKNPWSSIYIHANSHIILTVSNLNVTTLLCTLEIRILGRQYIYMVTVILCRPGLDPNGHLDTRHNGLDIYCHHSTTYITTVTTILDPDGHS